MCDLNHYLDFHRVGQVFCVRREVTHIKSQKKTLETVYGITSLSPQKASPVTTPYAQSWPLVHWKQPPLRPWCNFRWRPLLYPYTQCPKDYGSTQKPCYQHFQMVTMSLYRSNHQNYDLQTFSRSQTPSSLIPRRFSSPALFPESHSGTTDIPLPNFPLSLPFPPQRFPPSPLHYSFLTLLALT